MRFLPCGEELTLEPGESARVIASGPAGGELEVAWRGTEWAVYAWPGAGMRVTGERRPIKEIETARGSAG